MSGRLSDARQWTRKYGSPDSIVRLSLPLEHRHEVAAARMHPGQSGGGRSDRMAVRTLDDHGGDEREQSNRYGENGDAIGPSVAAGWIRLPKSAEREAHIEALVAGV